MSALNTLIQNFTKGPMQALREGKNKIVFADDVIFYIENTKESTKTKIKTNK